LLERLDRYPDGPGQLYEIMRWYSKNSRRREDLKVLDLERRALADNDARAREEMERILAERATARETTPQEELRRIKERIGDAY